MRVATRLRWRSWSKEMASRGAFIVFEGVDRSGKTTQVNKLVENLKARHIDAEKMHFPDRSTPIGAVLDSYLKKELSADPDVTHLLFAANRFEKREEVLRKLKSGTTIVLDRYAYSGVAFTMAKNVRGLDMAWCKGIEGGRLPAPDVVFFLNLPVEHASKRSDYGNEIYETQPMQHSVQSAYQKLRDGENWVEIDARQNADKIAEEILQQAADIVDGCQGGRHLKGLWDEKR